MPVIKNSQWGVMEISEENLQDMIYILNGVFAPLTGFMTSNEYKGVVDNMRLPNGAIWTIPITLDVAKKTAEEAAVNGKLIITYKKIDVAFMEVTSIYTIMDTDIEKIFGTLSIKHPGVAKEKEKSPYRVGGRIHLIEESIMDGELNPERTKAVFREKGWQTVVGFQTRNAIHKAHEYLQRTALEVCDGLFINPIIGWKKKGDFSEAAVIAAYEKMTKDFFPKERVYLDGLRTQMRYAGPREAIFHAIIRRNLGCTHFIIGRDHAGVDGFYEEYAAHELARKIKKTGNLGIQLLLLHGPYYCEKCGQIVTSQTCRHGDKYKLSISGTQIREMLMKGEYPDQRFMRPEITEAILSVGIDNVFIR